ncbi:MAG: TatD family hydrolase [Prevotellaceae bacterium]|jgi:TatD DNase family protein|nr:TatD family hydrolase [Prevotellaceae bacterium]
MNIADVHTHNKYPQPENVRTVFNLSIEHGSDIQSFSPQQFFSIGIHPRRLLDDYTRENRLLLRKYIKDRQFIFVGECGLDKYANVTSANQIAAFEEHIQLSETTQKPLLIHCVGRFNKLIEIKKAVRPTQKWIVHGFRNKPQLAGQLLNAGCDLSFGEYFNQESLRITPLPQLFLETDESSLPIAAIYAKAAAVKNCSLDDLSAGLKLLSRYSGFT